MFFTSGERISVGRGAFARAQLNLTMKEATECHGDVRQSSSEISGSVTVSLGKPNSLLVPLLLFYAHTYATVKTFMCVVIQAHCTINYDEV